MVSVVSKGACMGIRSRLHSDECLRVVPRLGRAATCLTIVPQSRCACTDLVSCLSRASCLFSWALGASTLREGTLRPLDPIVGYRVDARGVCASGNWHERLE